jgi:acyl-CoA thioester hydrolase
MWTTNLGVRFHELDAYGHVNHGVYLNYFEQARVELLDDIGFGLKVLEERGIQLVVVEVTIRYLAPAELGDRLVIETELVQLRRATGIWEQRLLRGDELLATARVRSAATNRQGRPIRPPEDLTEALRTV